MLLLDFKTTAENQLTNFEGKLFNISNTIIIDTETIVPLIIMSYIFLAALSCFLPCVLCKTINTIPNIICRGFSCLICRKQNKTMIKKAEIVEIKNDKKKNLISV
jgi:hypothetical protein